MSEEKLVRELLTAFLSLKSGTKIEKTKGDKKVTISVKKVEKL